MPTNTSRAAAAAVRIACSARSRSRTPRVRRRKSPSTITKRFMPSSVGRPGTRCWMSNPCVRGEEERAAALRLLGRLRRLYGVRFFDVVVADAWYAKGPFLQAVGALGWAVVVVLKQEDYDVYQEAWALTQGEPTEEFRQEGREVRLWEVRNLTFSKTYGRAVRVVRAEETWTEVKIVGGQKKPVPKQSNWLWVVTEDLGGYGGRTIWNLGHGRWRIENNAFNVLTQHWHLRHCAHHDPTSILA